MAAEVVLRGVSEEGEASGSESEVPVEGEFG